MIDYQIIGTGSSGNAVLINRKILVDCGLPWKWIEPYSDGINMVLLTHCHGDHFKQSTVRALIRKRPAVEWVCCDWMVEPLLKSGVNIRFIHVMDPHDKCTALEYKKLEELPWMWPGATLKIDRVAIVRPEFTLHNVPNCAWHIIIPSETGKSETIFYATDCSTLEGIFAENYDLYMIEANHSRAEIEERIREKKSSGEYAYEMEAMRNHLSREQAEEWLAENAGPHSQYVFLHQHIERKPKEQE